VSVPAGKCPDCLADLAPASSSCRCGWKRAPAGRETFPRCTFAANFERCSFLVAVKGQSWCLRHRTAASHEERLEALVDSGKWRDEVARANEAFKGRDPRDLADELNRLFKQYSTARRLPRPVGVGSPS
jgi:hypothetical protein